MDKNKTLELTNDYIFKRVFSKKGNEDILKDLLESILEIKIRKIEVVEEVEIQKVHEEDKLGTMDLKATLDKNTTVDIELQVKDCHNIIKRSLFYAAGLYHTGLKSGGDYKENNKVITINILFFNAYKWEKYHSIGKFKEIELNEVMTEEIEMHVIELPKFLKTKRGGSKKLRQWLDFIANKRKEEVKMAVKENEKIAKAQKEYEYLTGDAAVQRLAFLRDKWQSDHNSDIAWNRREAKKEGIKEGKREGVKEGEKSEKLKIAKNLLKEKVSIEIIIKVTGLKEEDLKQLEKQINKS